MKAVTYSSFGEARDVLVHEELPQPEPGPGEVLIRLHASGVNPSDIRARAGGRPGMTRPPFPKIIPHSDGAGVITATGDGVDKGRTGERVWVWNAQWQRAFGTAADYIVLPSEQAVPLAGHLSFAEGAVLGIPGLTACHAVLGGGPVEGKTLLISGGNGTVGNIAVQIARARGATVLATARGTDNLEAVKKAGAHHVFDYRLPDLADDILDATGGKAVDRILEVEFGKNLETNTRVIAERGTLVSFGSAQEMVPTLPFYPLLFKAVTIDLVLVYLLSATERNTAIQQLSTLLDDQTLELRISHRFKLEDCTAAHDVVASGQRSGSVIVEMEETD